MPSPHESRASNRYSSKERYGVSTWVTPLPVNEALSAMISLLDARKITQDVSPG